MMVLQYPEQFGANEIEHLLLDALTGWVAPDIICFSDNIRLTSNEIRRLAVLNTCRTHKLFIALQAFAVETFG